MTVLVLIFGEIFPKSLAKDNAEALSKAFSAPLSILGVILFPVTFVFSKLKKLISRKDDKPSVTEDELKFIINEIEAEGVLEERERDIVRSALEIDDMKISEVLIPRVRMVAVEENEDIERIKQLFFEEKYSRLPVYEKTIDNIIGFIHERDFFRFMADSDHGESIAPVVHDVLYVTEFETVSEVLSKMQKSKIHLAVVKDQYGGTFGMATMEDLIEEILGEIYDEADEEDDSLVKLGDDEYEAAADLSIHDFSDRTGLDDDIFDTESVTLGGWAMELFGKVPETGEKISTESFDITVLEAEDSRIVRLLLQYRPHDTEQTL